MSQRKSCLTCQRKPFAMLIIDLGAVFQENYLVNFAESIMSVNVMILSLVVGEKSFHHCLLF